MLDGYAPGAMAYFRVTAGVATVVSRTSDVVGIYAPASPARPALRVA